MSHFLSCTLGFKIQSPIKLGPKPYPFHGLGFGSITCNASMSKHGEIFIGSRNTSSGVARLWVFREAEQISQA